MLKSYCVGHVGPVFNPSIPYSMLCPKPLGLPGELVIDDDRFGLSVDGASLAEYSQLFGLSELISAGDVVADRLYLFQYRKFLSPHAGGAASVAPWVKVVTSAESPGVFPDQDLLAATVGRVIVGSIFPLGESIAANYARVHVVEDVAMFAAALATNSGLEKSDVQSFMTLQGFIPSPALCLTDVDLFLRIMKILQETWTEMMKHYHVRRDGYQRRVAGYLFERLHSYLLCKWLMDNTEPFVGTWQRYVVNDPVA